MPLRPQVAWIAESLLEFIVAESERALPSETGGVLLGYWDSGRNPDVVITEAVGPGPNTVRLVESFFPDYPFHEDEILRIYKESGFKHTYLGEDVSVAVEIREVGQDVAERIRGFEERVAEERGMDGYGGGVEG